MNHVNDDVWQKRPHFLEQQNRGIFEDHRVGRGEFCAVQEDLPAALAAAGLALVHEIFRHQIGCLAAFDRSPEEKGGLRLGS
jgi:hypothetical protein